ncbi:MAG TPA: cytochrome P450 [Microthrixaceae bacterium]|nr:cytochrome P450 [Microthrixaceae bacterium]
MSAEAASLTTAEADGLLLAVVLDDETRQDPVPVYRRLLAESPRWESATGMTILAGYHDGLEYLRNPHWGRAEVDMDLPPTLNGSARRSDRDTTTMLFLNPPDHTRIRSLVARAFTPRRVEELRGRIDELLTPILDEVADAGECDIMSTLAVPFPVAVISALLGVPQDPTGNFTSLVRDMTSFIDAAADETAITRAEAAAVQMAGYFLEMIEEKRATPDDGLLSALIQVEAEGERLSEDELLANTLLMYAAGFETTSNLIGNGLRALLAHPDELARLRSDRSLMSSAVQEILRFDSPVQLNVRFALQDDQLFGAPVPRGTAVMILQGSGNHDPAAYDRPERFDVGRFAGEGVPAPLSFGWGAHHCLGAHLARAEGEIVLGALLDRFEHIEVVGTEPRYRPSFTLRGLDQMTLAVS